MIKKLMPLMLVLALGACTTASTGSVETTRQPCCHECHKCKCEHCKKDHCDCAHKKTGAKQGEMCDMPDRTTLNN